MKDFLAKEMSKFVDDPSGGYEFPVEYFTGSVYPSSGYSSGFSSGYGYKRNDKVPGSSNLFYILTCLPGNKLECLPT